MRRLPESLRSGLTGRRVFFMLRGWPGLGRVMQGYALSQVLATLAPQQRQFFFSSAAGFAFLREQDRMVFDTRTHEPFVSWFGALGHHCAHEIMAQVVEQRPSAIVVDGELGLLGVVRAVYNGPVLALANPFDLDNPSHTPLFRAALRALHLSCDAVICASFQRVSKSLSPLPLRTISVVPPLVRHEVIAQPWSPTGTSACVVLGGGSYADSAMRDNLAVSLAAVIDVASVITHLRFFIYGVCEDQAPSAPSNVSFCFDRTTCLQRMVSATFLIARPGRNTIAEALVLGIPTVLLLGSTSGVRSSEQQANASHAIATGLSASIWTPGSKTPLLDHCLRLLSAFPTSPHWKPGNDAINRMLA